MDEREGAADVEVVIVLVEELLDVKGSDHHGLGTVIAFNVYYGHIGPFSSDAWELNALLDFCPMSQIPAQGRISLHPAKRNRATFIRND